MSGSSSPPAVEDGGGRSGPPGKDPSWGEKLEESWPLLTAGTGCVVLAVVLALQGSTRSIDHLSPTFLFLALGFTGIAGGVASFVVGPEEGVQGPAVGESESRVARPNRPTGGQSGNKATDHWNGRPVPEVTLGGGSTTEDLASLSATRRGAGGEPAENDPLRLLDSEAAPRTSSRNIGHLLRLSEEGSLTVYSLEDALRDLEVVDQVVHSHKVGRGAHATAARPTSTT
ncbi:MAG: hypothetical protein WA688_07345 [Thermoplasmata archaeon]